MSPSHLSVNNKSNASSGASGGGGGSGFTQVFFDDFSAGTVAEGSMFAVSGDHAKGLGSYTNWGAQTYLTTYGTPSHGNTGDYYGINNISVVSGISGATGTGGNCMRMRLLANDGTGKRVGACPYPNLGAYGDGSSSSGLLYGAVETRFMADSVAFWKTAWLFWPKTWVWTNEMDFPEGDLNSTIGGFVHTPNSPSTNAMSYGGSATYTSWHVARLEWTSASVRFLLDGTQVATTTVHPAESMFWQAQTENALSGTQPTSNANVYMDYCRLYSWA